MSAVTIAPGSRSRKYGALYVAEHRIKMMRRWVVSFFVIGFGTPVLYLLGLGAGLAVLITANSGPKALDGVDYITFLAPALLLAAGMGTAASDCTWGVFSGFKYQPIFASMHHAPITPRQMITGYLLALWVRVLPAASFTLIAMYAVGVVRGFGPLLLLPLMGLLAMAVGAPIAAGVATLREDRGRLAFIERFIITPLTLFSGTFFQLAQLPVWLHWLGWISPLWHAVELGRWASYGSAVPWWMVIIHLGYLIALTVGGWLLATRTFARRLNS